MKQWKPLALAACAALAICIYPLYDAVIPKAPLHSYILVDGSDPTVKTQYREEATVTGEKGGGEEDPNTGDLPGGAYIGDAPAQPAADAYQLLMDHFGDTLPDWYGGAYITPNGTLMVLLVNDKDPGDKTLELKVLDAVGKNAPVGFAGVKYSRNDLKRMNEELLTLLDGKGIPAMWGIYDDQNRIVLEVSQPLSDDLLAALAGIDPDDDAILVRVTDGSTVTTDLQGAEPAPIGEPVPGGVQDAPPYGGSVDEEEGEDPVPHFATDPGTVAPDDEDLEAIEPILEPMDPSTKELPATKAPAAHHDLLTIE